MDNGMMHSILWLALNIYHEARGEPVEGQKAVAKVTLTRAIRRKQSVEQVILAPRQFSWTHDGTPDYPTDYRVFFRCCESAHAAITEYMNGQTLEMADHYFNHNLVNPSWASGMKIIKIIGNHTFLK